jgi:hypothetical protein
MAGRVPAIGRGIGRGRDGHDGESAVEEEATATATGSKPHTYRFVDRSNIAGRCFLRTNIFQQ